MGSARNRAVCKRLSCSGKRLVIRETWRNVARPRSFLVMGGGAARWFHTLVVVGASLSACGGRAVEESPEPNAGGSANAGASGSGNPASGSGNSTSGEPRSPYDCQHTEQFNCLDFNSLIDCHCDTSAPLSIADCASPFAFQCLVDDVPLPPNTISTGPPLVGCTCLQLYASPADCAEPGQFTCTEYSPQYSGCRCDASLPGSAADCAQANCFHCESSNPRFGCSCECFVSIR